MTPRRLRYFLAIVEAESVTAAARALGVAQPALSQHLHALETEFGVPLFERHARGVIATEAGERLARHVRALDRQFERIAADVRGSMDDPLTGTVHLCIAASLAPVLAPALVRRVQTSAPGIELMLHSPLSVRARRMLASGEVDLAVLPGLEEIEGITAVPVYRERLSLLGRTVLLEGLPDPLQVRQLGRVELVAPSRPHSMRQYLEWLAAQAGVTLRIRYTIDDALVTRALIREGLGCAVLPISMLGSAITGADEMAVRRLVRPVPGRLLSIAWVADRPLQPAALFVRENVLDCVRGLVASRRLDGRASGEADPYK
ncbi:MAG: LysR family transcriptional regulator [Burkholderiaceae bacterium]